MKTREAAIVRFAEDRFGVSFRHRRWWWPFWSDWGKVYFEEKGGIYQSTFRCTREQAEELAQLVTEHGAIRADYGWLPIVSEYDGGEL